MSDLLKIKRLVDGDDLFAWRVEAACWQHAIDYTPQVVRYVASDSRILDKARIDDPDTIISEDIEDNDIITVVGEYKANQPQERMTVDE